MGKLSKQEKKKIQDKYLEEIEHNPIKILHDFNLKLEFDDCGFLIYPNNSYRFENIRSDGDIRNQTNFILKIFDNDILLFSIFYVYSIENRTIDCKDKHTFHVSSNDYNTNDLIIIALSSLGRLHSHKAIYCKQ